MKESIREKGYVIKQEFIEMKGRFDKISLILLVLYAFMSVLLIIELGMPDVLHKTSFWIMITVHITILVVGVLSAICYIIQSIRGKGESSFAISIFWMLLSGCGCFKISDSSCDDGNSD